MQVRRPNAQRSEETRAALLAAARKLFIEKGFAATSTPGIVAAAQVTRGALYHHFADKTALFRAVVQAESQALATGIVAATEGAAPLDALLQGADHWFAAMQDKGRARLLLVEAPAVLGPADLACIDAETSAATLREGLAALPGCNAGRLDALTDLVSAMFDRAALAISSGKAAGPYRAELERLLRALAV